VKRLGDQGRIEGKEIRDGVVVGAGLAASRDEEGYFTIWLENMMNTGA